MSKQKKPTKKQRIFQWMSAGNSITPMLAQEMFNCMSLAQRIHEFKKEGYKIGDRVIITSTGSRPKEYWLEA